MNTDKTNVDLALMRRRRNRLKKHFDKYELSAMYASVDRSVVSNEDGWDDAFSYAYKNCTKDEIATWLSCLVDNFDQMIKEARNIIKNK